MQWWRERRWRWWSGRVVAAGPSGVARNSGDREKEHGLFGIGELPEAEACVEGSSLPVDGIYDDGAGADDEGGCEAALQGVGEQGGSETLCLEVDVDGELAEEKNRDRIWHVAGHAGWKAGGFDGIGGNTVEGDDMVGGVGDYVGSRSALGFVGVGMGTKPGIDGGSAGCEAGYLMGAKGFRRAQEDHGAGRLNSSVRAGSGVLERGASRASTKAW